MYSITNTFFVFLSMFFSNSVQSMKSCHVTKIKVTCKNVKLAMVLEHENVSRPFNGYRLFMNRDIIRTLSQHYKLMVCLVTILTTNTRQALTLKY